MSKYIIAVACYGPPCGHAPLGRRTREGPRAIPREGVNKYIYIYIYMTRRARGPCLPRARVMVWVRSARNPNPLAVTTLSPHPYSHINSVRWGWFFLMGGKTETRPPESHVFDSQKTPIFTMLGLGSPLPWGPTLASVPRDSPSKKLTAPHGVDRLFFCLTERGNSHRPQWGGRWRDRFYGPKLPASLGYLPLQ